MTNKSSKIPDEIITRPRLSFIESWQDESGIDTGIWTPTNSATGTAWNIQFFTGNRRMTAFGSAGLGENQRLVSVHRWPLWFGANNSSLADAINRKLILEMELLNSDPTAGIDTTGFFCGLSAATTATRTSQNIVGIILDGNDYYVGIVDRAGTEQTVSLQAGGSPTQFPKIRLELSRGFTKFFMNEAQIGTIEGLHPNMAGYLNFYNLADGVGPTCQTRIGPLRLWYEDVLR